MSIRVSSLEDDVRRLIQEGGMKASVRMATTSELDTLSDVWECTSAVFLDEHIALGVVSHEDDSETQELWWYVYTFIDGEWGSHNDTGEGRSFAEALSDAVSMLFWLRTYQLAHGIQE